MVGKWNHGMIVVVEIPFAWESEPYDLTTNVASDSCAVQCALTMRYIMALGKSAGSSSFHMSTEDHTG
jgi:hypothetical protein